VSAFRTIKDEADKLVELIKGIEDLTVAEASFVKKSEFTPINLKEFFSELVNELLPLADGKKFALTLAQDQDFVVHTDADKLEKIIRNLLSNCIMGEMGTFLTY